MDYKTNELTGLITPIEITSSQEYFRVMGKNSREIYCVYEIDPDCTCHPTGIEWDVNGVHKHLPFKKGAGVNGLTITGEVRADKELRDKAPERKATKAYKAADKKAEEKDIEEFYATPEEDKTKIIDMSAPIKGRKVGSKSK